jgi:hypothetical protein
MGECLLALLSLFSAVGTVWADFRSNHIFNPEWPAHARFHAVLYALMNIGCSILALCLILFHPFGRRPSVIMAVVLLALLGTTLFLALLIPGVSSVAYEKEIQWKGVAISLWMGIGFLALTSLGAFLAL